MFVEQIITQIVYGKSISQKQLTQIIHSDCVLNRLLSWILLKCIQIRIWLVPLKYIHDT